MVRLKTRFQQGKRKRNEALYNDYLAMCEDPTIPKMEIYNRLMKKYNLHSTSSIMYIINAKREEMRYEEV